MGEQRGFGRDGITGLVTPDSAMRARDVSRPSSADLAAAKAALDAQRAGRPRPGPRPQTP